MDKWILVMGFASMTHIVDVFDGEKECLVMMEQVNKELLTNKRLRFVGACIPAQDILLWDRSKVYTLR